jgi:PST family polysaccharide transporter
MYLALRQGIGIVVATFGALALTRAIGPEAYGVWWTALGIYMYLNQASQCGMQVYLVRREDEPAPDEFHQAFTLLMVVGGGVAALALLALPFLQQWVRVDGFTPIALVLFAGLPANLLRVVPTARLERNLNFRAAASIELSGQVASYAVALPLAFAGFGPWAPLAGWWTETILCTALLFRVTAYRPRLRWDGAQARSMLRYGLGFTSSSLVWQLRTLVSPLIVGRYAGADAVGFVALTVRLVDQLSFVKNATWRLSIAALARIQGERDRLRKAVSDGTSLQVAALGPALAAFGLAAPWLVPMVLGDDWLPLLYLYPLVALAALSNAMFNLHSSALYVLRANWKVAAFNVAYVVLFVSAALVLVPRLGAAGYGWAELVALPSYALLHAFVVSKLGSPGYARAGIWFAASAVCLFGWQLGPWAWTAILVPLVLPVTRQEIVRNVATVLGRTKRQEGANA